MARPIEEDTFHDEVVQVNQRALIDKILARYPSEHSIFRELLQNSDDAQAQNVEIHFKSAPLTEEALGRVQDSNQILINHWIFQNDGKAFGTQDWNRLKKIAEGNPDEQKIGAFGVGFYAVFSKTNRPLISSGSRSMEFYWKDDKDQLYARVANLSEPLDSWTRFDLPLRDPSAIPIPCDLIRFLSSSITFMTSIRKITVFVDDVLLAQVTKSVGTSEPVKPSNNLTLCTRKRQINFERVDVTPVQICTDAPSWAWSQENGLEKHHPPETPMAPAMTDITFEELSASEFRTSSTTLSIYSAQLVVELTEPDREGLLRSTKKEPPSRMQLDFVYL